MAEFLVENYLPRGDSIAAAERAEQTRRVAEELSHGGEPVRCLRSIFVPGGEPRSYLYEAVTATRPTSSTRRDDA